MEQADGLLFAAGGIDRAAHLRGDAAALAALAAAPAARALAVWRGRPLMAEGAALRPAWLALDHPLLASAGSERVFLGLKDGAARFAVDVSAWEGPGAEPGPEGRFGDTRLVHHPVLPAGTAFADLRAHLGLLDPAGAGVAATARALAGWHGSHRHCARCGAPSESAEAGWRRACPACGAQHFPRTDPVVIMLVTDGSAVLLGRQRGWPAAMFSLLAGYVEPGETLEAAVRRETLEEAGVAVDRVRYLASQPWPFPASLMIGCLAEARRQPVRIDPAELEAARWVSRQELMAALAGRDPTLSPGRPGAIARFLLARWLADRLDD